MDQGKITRRQLTTELKKKLLCEKLTKNSFNMKYNYKQEKRMKI